MIKLIRSWKDGGHPWQEINPVEFDDNYNRDCPTVVVKSGHTYQTHLGFGGAFTESAAQVVSQCGKDVREEVLRAYFDKETGLGYNLGRLCIHSSDFANGNYTYIEEGDKDLVTFNLSHEEKWVIPFVKDACETAGERLKLMAAPWSPPAFMKSNGEMNHGGTLLEEYRESWANYFVKFILDMEKRGVKIDAISVQNEPEAIQVWDSLEVSAQEEGVFIVDFLAPALKRAGLGDIKIILWDHNKDRVVPRVNTAMSIPGVAENVWGTGYHWYVSDASENLEMLHTMYPDKHIIFTEGCIELTNTAMNSKAQGVAGEWEHGEVYGRNIINDFNHYCDGWIDWNLVLNEQGGPNHVKNFCEAPVMINRDTQEIMYNASYYYIGHFSRYILPGAKRVFCMNDIDKKFYTTAYENPDGELIIVIQNEGKQQKVAFIVDEQGVNLVLPEQSITTCIIKN